MQIKTALRHHFTPTEMTVIRQTITSADKNVEKLEPSWIAGGNVSGIATLEDMFLKQLNVNFVSDLTLLLLGIYPRELKIHVYTKIMPAF